MVNIAKKVRHMKKITNPKCHEMFLYAEKFRIAA